MEIPSFFPFFFVFPCILIVWLVHKVTGACHQLHSSRIHLPRGVQLFSSLPLALEQTGAKLGSHGQAPAASMLCYSSVETGQKGQRDPGVLQVSLRTQNSHANQIVTGNHKDKVSISVHSPLLWGKLLAGASEGSGSRHPFASISHLSWSETSESNEGREVFHRGSYALRLWFRNPFLLITYSFQLFPRQKK